MRIEAAFAFMMQAWRAGAKKMAGNAVRSEILIAAVM